jgi:acyl carrier protein
LTRRRRQWENQANLPANQEQITQIIYEVIDETNAELPAEKRLEKSPETVLLGSHGKLDSLGVVHLIVAVEDRLRDDLGVSVTLADERAMSQNNSPFRSVSSLSAYIAQLMESDA